MFSSVKTYIIHICCLELSSTANVHFYIDSSPFLIMHVFEMLRSGTISSVVMI